MCSAVARYCLSRILRESTHVFPSWSKGNHESSSTAALVGRTCAAARTALALNACVVAFAMTSLVRRRTLS